MHIFLIDDDPVMVKLQTMILTRAGHTVTTEVDSDVAMSRIKELRPDCVVTDLMMPGIDGYQLISLIRKEPDLGHVIIIVLSSKMFPQDRRQAFEFGANGFISKPISPATFLEKVAEIIENPDKAPNEALNNNSGA